MSRLEKVQAERLQHMSEQVKYFKELNTRLAGAVIELEGEKAAREAECVDSPESDEPQDPRSFETIRDDDRMAYFLSGWNSAIVEAIQTIVKYDNQHEMILHLVKISGSGYARN